MNRIQLLLSTSLLVCAGLVQPAFAQDASAQAAASPSNQPSNDSQALQEVVVTAERRFSTAQKTAASISVRSGQDMLLQGRYELKDILQDVPGISGGAAIGVSTTIQGLGTDNPATGLTIRGVQSNTGAGGSVTTTAAAAAIYVDDVYNGIGGAYDLDRIEILRGPQGTLYGRSATAGVVAIHTRDPNTKRFSADGTAELGNYDLRHFTGDVNVPIIKDTLALRLSGNFYDRDGYYSAKGGAVSAQDFRVKALWNPTDNFSALVGYSQEYNVTHSGGVSIDPGNSPGTFVYTAQPVPPAGHNDFHQYWADFNLNLGPVAITYIPAYRTWYQKALITQRGAQNFDQTVYTPTDTFLTQEVRIRNTDNDANFKWQAGFLYYDNKLSNSNSLYSLPGPGPFPLGVFIFQAASHKTTTAEGAFAEATYAFASDTRLTAGIRYDHTQVRNNEIYSAFDGPPASLTGDQGLRKFNNFNYKVRLEHDLTPRNLLYAAISTGSSPGDIALTTSTPPSPPGAPPNPSVVTTQVLRAETLTAYEIGSKNRFFDNHLQVNGDVYYDDYAGFQTVGLNVTPFAPFPTFNTLVSPMKAYGAELEVEARPWANGTVSLSASYTHARYDGFGQFEFLFSKNDVPGVAPFQGSVAYDHRIPIGSATLVLHGDVHFFTGHDTMSISQDWAANGVGPYVHVPSEAVGDLNGTLLFGEHYSITAYVRNISDERFIPDDWAVNYAAPQGSPPGTPRVVSAARPSLSDPRTFGVVLNVTY